LRHQLKRGKGNYIDVCRRKEKGGIIGLNSGIGNSEVLRKDLSEYGAPLLN